MTGRARGAAAIFALPLLIALASMVGLIAALLGDGAYDLASWITLGLPVAAFAWCARHRRT